MEMALCCFFVMLVCVSCRRNKFLLLLTVRIRVRSIRFLITADSSSGVTCPFPLVNPSKKSLFHCSSGAENTQTHEAIVKSLGLLHGKEVAEETFDQSFEKMLGLYNFVPCDSNNHKLYSIDGICRSLEMQT